MIEKSCQEFVNILSAKEPVPGGGGAAALTGALSIALGSMVGEYTLGKKKYAHVEEEIRYLLERAETLRKKFLELVEEDAKGFEPLSQAYAMPADDPKRGQVMEEATKNALVAPLKMLESCGEAIELIRQFQLKGTVMLLSDAGCGAALCRGAMQAAAMNIFVNTKGLTDREFAIKIEEKVDKDLKKYIPLADTIVSEVNTKLREE